MYRPPIATSQEEENIKRRQMKTMQHFVADIIGIRRDRNVSPVLLCSSRNASVSLGELERFRQGVFMMAKGFRKMVPGPGKAMSRPCLELAKLFSIAVDFPKTGVPAEIPQELRVKEYPDFMEKPDKPSYQSHNVIGKLFREVKNLAPNECSIKFLTREKMQRFYDPDMEVEGFEDYIDDAFFHKSKYDYKLGNLMDYYGVKTEAEILGGGIMKMSRSFTKKRDAEAISMAVRSLRKEARSWFNEKGSELDEEIDDAYAKASAWYYVTYHPSYWGQYNEGMNRDHFLSFPWCVYDMLIQIKKEKAAVREALDLSSLEHRFQRGLHLH